MRLLTSIFLLSIVTAPALAQPAVAPPAPETVTPAPGKPTNVSPATMTAAERKAKAKADGVVCHQETRTGSHLPVKVCTTAADRQAARASAERTQENVQGHFTPSTVPN